MDTVETAGVTYSIYTRQEADEKGLDYTYWKDVSEVGQWAITDDDYVCEVRKIYGPYPPNKDRQIMLAGGTGFDSKSDNINYEEYKAVGNYNYIKPQRPIEHAAKSSRMKRAINFYALQMTKGVDHADMPFDLLGKMIVPNGSDPTYTAKRRFKSKHIMQKVNEEIIRILDDKGLSKDDVVKGYKKLMDLAGDKEDLTNLRLTLDSIAKMHGIDKPKQDYRIEEDTVRWSRQIGEGLQKEKQQIEASRKRQAEAPEDEETD